MRTPWSFRMEAGEAIHRTLLPVRSGPAAAGPHQIAEHLAHPNRHQDRTRMVDFLAAAECQEMELILPSHPAENCIARWIATRRRGTRAFLPCASGSQLNALVPELARAILRALVLAVHVLWL